MSAPSSPASSRGGSPAPMLTPRSKIKALLATVGSSDDEDGTSTPLKTTARTSVRSALAQLDDDDSESDVEIRPRGRLAARMQANSASPNEKKPQNARERVKQMLEREEGQQQPQEEQNDDDDDLPVAPRRLQRRQARDTTPEQDSTQQNNTNPSSPGLFVSSPAGPSPTRSVQQNDSNSDSDALPDIKSNRFKALVERKRQERLAREAKEEAERAERRARQEKLSSELDGLDSNDDDVSNIDDDEGGQTLTQKSARPSRKASKKAVEEMNRETQRMARSMQLAHEAKTRKKITKSSLFERFNFRPNGQPAEPVAEPAAEPASSSRPTTPQSDVEMADAETPPSSPPSAKKAPEAPITMNAGIDIDEDLPTLDEISGSARAQPIEKSKSTAVEVAEEKPAETETAKTRVRVRLPNLIKSLATGSDDELEITATVQDKVKAVFDNVPVKAAQESHSLQVLRALALVQSPDRNQGRRKKNQTGMTNNQLQASLQQRARQQAKLERARRLELLKSQGIVVQTMEEREKQMEEVEDIVTKARNEVQRLMEHEREAAKKEQRETTTADPLAWDDSDDEYQASEKEMEVEAIELSGSEEDEGDDADDESDAANPLFDDEAEDEDVQDETKANEDEEMEEAAVLARRRRPRNVTVVISDDEGEVEIKSTPKPVRSTNQISPAAANGDSPAAPGSVLRSAKKTFIPGLPVKGPAGLGLTQIFAGTMDDSQIGTANAPTQSMMPDFDQFPDSNFSATMGPPEDHIVMDSQRPETQGATQGIRLNMSQSQMHGLDSLMRDYPGESQTIELSQDGGFQAYTPLRERFVEPPFSTVATDVAGTMEDGPQASPLLRRGKLRRKADVEKTVEPTQPIATEVSATAEDAFAKLKAQAKQKEKRRLTDAFNTKTSKAKEMVEQEAMESDDEYAGLGGVDGEDSDNESNASVKEMIDDATANNADDSKLAAFYADRARAEDEQQVEKLFKDITTGNLRRKRGADYDLSDSDDDGEARRRMKRRQFAKMQKALFSDERVKKMAENPGNQAFLRTIEDRGSDDEMDILEIVESPSQRDSSQSPAPETQEGAQQTIPDSQPQQPARQALATAPAGGDNNRPPARMRRTKDAKKPSNIGEVRETLSNLLEEPDASLIPATEAGSDSEDEDGASRSNKENRSPRRTAAGVVDRISLKRGNSNVSSSSSRLAFASAASASGAAFKVPPLLRRATTNSSIISTAGSTTSSGSAAGGFGEEAKIKKAAGKRSGVVSRAVPGNEGHARIQESERRREEKKMKGAEKRLGVVGGLLGRGSFA
ncbi:hypothetical protein LMH87_000882 [Akanthomyces muscarius]|uniref:DNA replication checkpoint mediator MRC1 domain-containing protein n=1 Tax=Akanthomyces muscarius TaxID=2231603 RepID=A0A9W8UP83_AKAMU|nr:hypothetical protein LMH87_000882 [Akanthomyces muscarius]KAJ4155646.1 hypothetical protein LMH87_000882 [Akanthomyces muscarius]